MASSKQDGTAAAAQQLGSMSLGESTERKDDDTANPTTKNGTTPTKKLCSACGKKSDTVKKCNGCKCVWYCDKKCQNKHRKEHRKECKRIKVELDKRGGKLDLGEELDVGPVGKVPQREECPICMRLLPLFTRLQTYAFCCGKTICCGCDLQHNIKNEKRELMEQTPGLRTCAFCRTAAPDSDEEILAQVRKRAELQDPQALSSMALSYGCGRYGLPVDEAKCVELLRQAAGLGLPGAQYQLGAVYHDGEFGLEQNEEEGRKWWEKAAEGGHLLSLHTLGNVEGKHGDHVAGMRHLRMSASGGYRKSIEVLIGCFEIGFLYHDDLAETMQSFYRARDELKSKDRDQYIAYLKSTGEYKGEYDD